MAAAALAACAYARPAPVDRTPDVSEPPSPRGTVETCAAPPSWTIVGTVERLVIHDGLSLGPCEFLVVGESLADGRAIVLRSPDAGRTLDELARPPASRLSRIVGDRRSLYALGQDAGESAILLRSSDAGRSWLFDRLPLGFGYDMAIIGTRFVVVGEGDGEAVALVGSPTEGWRELLSLPRDVVPTRLDIVTARGGVLAVGGRRGDEPLLFLGSDQRLDPVNVWSVGAVTSLAFRGDDLVVSGFEGASVETGRGVAGRVSADRAFDSIPVVPDLRQLLSITCRSAELCLAIAPTGSTSTGDRIVRLTGSGWTLDEQASLPVLGLGRLFLASEIAFAVGSQQLLWASR